MRATSSARSSSWGRWSPSFTPPRRIVIRSLRASTCSRKWETNRIATPWSRRRRITWNRRATSSASRLEVGSSSTSTRGRSTMARAMETSWRLAGERSARRSRGSRSARPSSASIAAARAWVARHEMPSRPRASWPSITFSPTLRFSTRCDSWNAAWMPRARASAGPPSRTGSPSTRISPASIRCTPSSALISVDLPEPFSPRSACTSPGCRSRSTPSSATPLGKATVMPRMRTVGRAGAWGRAVCADPGAGTAVGPVGRTAVDPRA